MTEEINDPIAALRTELSRVAPSPGFAERVRERLADELEPLRAELTDLTVSSDFAVRVRNNIQAGGSRRGRSWSLFNWRLVVPAAGLAAAAAVAAFAYFRPVDAPATTQVAVVRPVVTPVVEPPKVGEPPKVAAVAPSQTVRPAVTRIARVTTDAPAPVREPRDPMLEVITDQPAILRDLWVRVTPGVTVDSTEPAAIYQAPKLEVGPIEVSPVSRFLVPDLRAPVGVAPIILRLVSVGTPAPHLVVSVGTSAPHLVTAESAERSSR